MSLVLWPPKFSIRKHRLAKKVSLRISIIKGLEITVPLRFNIKEIPKILDHHKSWIITQLEKLPQTSNILPKVISLRAINEEWNIHYIQSKLQLKIFQSRDCELTIVGDTNQIEQCKALLRKWLKKYVRIHLKKYLDTFSRETNLLYTKFVLRDQKSRWGSCSYRHSISLNYKLIFLPFNLVKYVIIHELCHTRHLNHSKNFWQLVESFDAEWRANRRELRHVSQFIPAWYLENFE